MAQPTLTAHEWIDDICRRFSAASGWPLSFEPDESVATDPRPDRNESADRCWSADVHDKDRRIGRLLLDLPAEACNDRSFLAAQGLAELVAEMVGQLAGSRRQLQSRTQQFSTLVDVGRSLPRKQNLPGALQQLLAATVKLTGFRSVAFFLLDPTTSRLKLRAQQHVGPWQVPFKDRRLDRSTPDLEAFDQGKIVWRPQPGSDDSRWLPQESSLGVCLAVESDAGPLGTLWAFDRRQRTPSQREFHVLESIAGQISSVLERAVLMQESAVQHRMRRDLAVASECQRGELIRGLPSDSRLDIAGICTSRYELGGDLCEVSSLDERSMAIAVGDASGDSVAAAMIMSSVRGAMRSMMLREEGDLTKTEWVMQEINHVLFDMTPAHQFMSMLYGVLDTDALTFTYTNAGHPLPLVVRDAQTETLESHGMLLGVMERYDYSKSVVQLSAGDLLVLYSDGVSEAMSRGKQMFRSDGIVEAFEGNLSGTAQHVLHSIWSKLESHLHGGEADDRTLLVIKVRD